MIKDLAELFLCLIDSKGPDYIREISVITSKSLVPSRQDAGIRIDYKRFIEELRLWLYYRADYNNSLKNINRLDEETYFNEIDDSIFSRIIPLVIVNRDRAIMEEEVIKNILFTSGNIESLFTYYLMAYTLSLKIDGEENLIDRLKDIVINFSQKTFMASYEKFYRLDLNINKKFKIDIELERIKLLNYLNGESLGGYGPFREVLELSLGKDIEVKSFEARVVKGFLDGKNYDLDSFYKNLANYLMNLRNSRIDIDRLKIEKYILPDLFQYEKGDSFFHSLLGNGIVENKTLVKDTIELHVLTKSGRYILKKHI